MLESMKADATLRKRGWRMDLIWTLPFLYRSSIVKRFPVSADTKALLKSQYWPREKLNTHAEERLRDAITAALRLPFWHERLGATFDPRSFSLRGIAHIPILSKRQLIERPLSDYADTSLIFRSHRDATSGSTGQPFEFYYDWPAELRSFAICERMFLAAAGARYPVIGMRARHKPGFAFFKHHFFYLSGSNALRHRLTDLITTARSHPEGCILYGYTSAIIETARLIAETGESIRFRAAIATGEPLTHEQRVFIETTLHTKFFLNYASREMGWLGFECEHHNMHLNEEWAYVETVDENGSPVGPGVEGAIVVSLFDNRAMPLLRYDSGDRGVVSAELCACGRTLRTLTFSGRRNDQIELIGGRIVPLINLSGSLDWFARALRQFQIVQTGELDFTMRVVPGDTFYARRVDIHDHLVRILHPDTRITWEVVDDIPAAKSGKAIYFLRDFSKHHAA